MKRPIQVGMLIVGFLLSAAGYNIYYSQGGKYTFDEDTTSRMYVESGLKPGQTYCYAVTAYRSCADGSSAESWYSITACAVPTR